MKQIAPAVGIALLDAHARTDHVCDEKCPLYWLFKRNHPSVRKGPSASGGAA